MNILISGGTKGIGRAIAERFASAGFDLIICARHEKDLLLMQKSFEKDNKIKCDVYVCDMSDDHSLQSFIKSINKNHKQIDVLVNNAGLFKPGELMKEKDGLLQELFQLNVLSAYILTRGIFSLLKKSKKAHIFNNCSIASIAAYKNGGSYSITKYALLGFTKNLREELKPHNIRVTGLMPGATWSDSWKDVKLPKERLMPASDIAEMIFASYSLSNVSVVEDIVMRPLQGDIKEEEF